MRGYAEYMGDKKRIDRTETKDLEARGMEVAAMAGSTIRIFTIYAIYAIVVSTSNGQLSIQMSSSFFSCDDTGQGSTHQESLDLLIDWHWSVDPLYRLLPWRSISWRSCLPSLRFDFNDVFILCKTLCQNQRAIIWILYSHNYRIHNEFSAFRSWFALSHLGSIFDWSTNEKSKTDVRCELGRYVICSFSPVVSYGNNSLYFTFHSPMLRLLRIISTRATSFHQFFLPVRFRSIFVPPIRFFNFQSDFHIDIFNIESSTTRSWWRMEKYKIEKCWR